MMPKIHIPYDVPKTKHAEYLKNFRTATRGTGKLLMFACDQKVEHLNDDFVGLGISPEVADAKHYFEIAKRAHIGVLGSQLGLIAKYGDICPETPFIIKANSKTNIIQRSDRDPFSNRWLPMDDIIEFKKNSGLNIVGVGYTVYIGSTYESESFGQAARIVYKAHQEGLLAIVWMYPRGRAVKNEEDIHLLAGGAGVAVCLGADFVKINYPYSQGTVQAARKFQEVVRAAGRTGVICIGGKKMPVRKFLEQVHNQINVSGTMGVAIGRNIFQRPLDEAIRMADSIAAVSLYGYSVNDAYKIFTGKSKLKSDSTPKKSSIKSFLSFSL
jgi:fructose-bisphosphate aldolase / 6-deoxy-5-ketofructose 1-phosphate synthase